MKYVEQKELVASLRELADFFEQPNSITLPVPTFWIQTHVYEYARREDGSRDYSKVDEFETRMKMRNIAKVLSPCEKDYSTREFALRRKFGNLRVEFNTIRAAVCEKKVISTKTIPAETRVIPERIEEEIEWVCTDSLLKA